MPRGTGSPGSVTSTASARSAASSSRVSSRSRSSRVQPLELAAHAVQLLAARSAQLGRQARRARAARASARSSARAPRRARPRARRPWWPARAARAPGVPGWPRPPWTSPRRCRDEGRLPRGTTLLAPCRRLSLSARSAASRPAREVNFGGPSARGLSVTAPLPVEDGARLLVSVGAGAAILPRVRRGAAAPGGEPYERLGPLYDRWCAGVDHDIAFYVLACEGATGPIVELGAGSGRIAVELARHGHRVIALDASPAMLAQAERRARRHGVDDLLETVLGDLRDPPALPPSDRVIAPVPHVHAPRGRRRAPPRPERRRRRCWPRAASSSSTSSSPAPPTSARRTTAGSRAARASASARSGTRPKRGSSSTCACPAVSSAMTLEWRSAEEWRALCLEAGLTVLSSRKRASAASPWAISTGDQVYICALA